MASTSGRKATPHPGDTGHPLAKWADQGPTVPVLLSGLAFLFYAATAAPGLTWANYGADGGDLLAAAMTNGVPHPTGYPLYILLLQGWLALLGWIGPASDVAWRGNLFSSLAAAVSVGFTAYTARRLAPEGIPGSVAALFVGLAWATAPLLWGQALITEVYGLHAALFTALGCLLLAARLAPRLRLLLTGLVLGLGLAHHLTILLLVPAVLYWLATDQTRPLRSLQSWLLLVLGAAPGLLLYIRIPLVAALEPTPPVNWGHPVDFSGFWWLVSGAAYRRYLFAVPAGELLGRAASWAQTITNQYTPVGFALILAGLYRWDRLAPRLRNTVLWWIGPISVYVINYNTADSVVYLLPLVWMMALLLPAGVVEIAEWLEGRLPARPWRSWLLGATLVGLIGLTGFRIPMYSLRSDTQARTFLQGAIEVLEPNSLIFSSADRETFALWYGAWATSDLLKAAPDAVLVNVALLQFDWYRVLLTHLYPDLPGVQSGTAAGIMTANVGHRPIFFSEKVAPAQPDQLVPAGPIWRLSDQ